MTTAPTADAIKTSFTFAQFDQIVGEPTYSTLYKLETQATRNAATVSIRLPPPHTNCSGIVEQPAVYVLRAGGPFPRPTYPGDQPVFPAGARVTDRTTIQNRFDLALKNYNTCQTTENLLKTMLENAVEHSYLAGIHSEILGFGPRSLQDIFLHLYQSYGRISPSSLKSNTDKLTNPIAAHLPIALVFRQIEDCQRFATAGGAAFTQEQLIKAAETLILNTGKYQLAYREWINLPPPQKTFNTFRTRFAMEYQILNEMQNSTAQQQGFVGNVEEDPDLTSAVANFAQASAADRTAFTQLTDTNAYLHQHMAQVSAQNENLQKQLADMQQQMNAINLVQPAAQPPPMPRRPPAVYTTPVPHYQRPPQAYAPPPATYQQNQPTPAYQQPTYGRGGRTPYRGGRARGRGRGGQRGPPQQTVPYGQQQQQPPNPVKRHSNWNYCHTHGFDVQSDHTSENCQRPGWNHNYYATRNNTMGGSNRNQNKTVLPDPNQAYY